MAAGIPGLDVCRPSATAPWVTVNSTSETHRRPVPCDKQARMAPVTGWALLGPIIIAGLSGCGSLPGSAADQTPTPAGATSSAPAETHLQQAARSCGLYGSSYGAIGDDGYSITLQSKPKKGSRGGLSLTEIDCVLDVVKVPNAIASQMDGTRALDGTQDATWDKISATWTYHPDNGFRIILTELK